MALTERQLKIIRGAERIISENMREYGEQLNSPANSIALCKMHFADQPEREKFAVMFLNSQNCLIKFEDMFTGTIDGAAVYPREVVKEALNCNAAAVIFTHNHPSGVSTPSAADRRITERLQAALALVDIRVLDHIVVGDGEVTSFAEGGLL